MKNTLNSLFKYCGINSEVEPYGVFSDLVPQQPLNRAEAFRASQTIIPDIRAELPDDLGGTSKKCLEVKTVSGLSRWYLPVRGDRAVERRTLAIDQEYKNAASAADQRYYNTNIGPISQRLNTLSLIGVSFCRFGEPQTLSTSWCQRWQRQDASNKILPLSGNWIYQEKDKWSSCQLLWAATCLQDEPGGRSECTAGSWQEAGLGDGGGEGKRREGGSLGGNCGREGHCEKGSILGKLKRLCSQ